MSENGLRKEGKESGFGVSWCIGGRAGVMIPAHMLGTVWFELPASTKVGSTWLFFTTCPKVDTEGKRNRSVGA